MSSGSVLSGIKAQAFYLRFEGDVRLPWCVILEDHCRDALTSNDIQSVKVDINPAINLDSTTLGVLAKVGMLVQRQLGFSPELYCIGEDLLRLIKSMSLDSVFQIREAELADRLDYDQIQFADCEEETIQEDQQP